MKPFLGGTGAGRVVVSFARRYLVGITDHSASF